VEVKEAPIAVEYLPAEQLLHLLMSSAPSVIEYFPAIQLVQVEFE
jgi:hypothetical protein